MEHCSATLFKNEVFHKDFFSKFEDLVKFTEEILMENVIFCAVKWIKPKLIQLFKASYGFDKVFLNSVFIQKQPPEVFYKKTVLKNFAIFIGKKLGWSLFLIKWQGFFCEYCEIFNNA